MVKFWVEMRKLAIKKQKIRIDFCEKHGIGDSTIKEKAILKRMERLQELKDK